MMFTPIDQWQLEKTVCTNRLSQFTKQSWLHVETRPLVWSWHMGAISDHLEAVSRGEIKRLIINIPPRHSKSLLVNVIWPCWDWLHNSWRIFMLVSYRQGLSIRDQRKAKVLMQSDWYRSHFDPQIEQEPNTSARWGIVGGGERLISSVGGASSTGEGADAILIDDPISADGARSPAKRKAVLDWWDDTIKSRFNDPKTGVFVVVMQRLHEEDLTGHILAHETGWDHLCLPARYDPDHKFPIKSSIGFKDPRTKEGELLNPRRFTEEELSNIAKPGTYSEAGQLQQQPAPRSGGFFARDWFEILPAAPKFRRLVRAWDLAATANKDAAYTAGVLMGETFDGTYVVVDVVRGQLSAAGVETLIRNTASQDRAKYGALVKGSIPKDPGASGKVWAQTLVKATAGHVYRASPESGDKETRAEPVSAQAEVDNIKLVAGAWNKDYLDELTLFPNGKFKDQVDATSRAFMELTSAPRGALVGTQG